MTNTLQEYDAARDSIANTILSKLSLGARLLKIKNEKLYIGLGFENFKSFYTAPLESGGLGLVQRSANECVKVVDKLMIECEYSVIDLVKLPWDNLVILAPIITVNNHKEVMKDAGVLTARDCLLNKKHGKYLGEEQKLEATKEPKKSKTITSQCPRCHKSIQIETTRGAIIGTVN